MSGLQDKHIVLGIAGGIAAYKTPDLVRRLAERGAEVEVVMTAGARHFVTRTALQAVTHRPLHTDLWDASVANAMGHIELAKWAETLLIAPATADVIARLAQGRADDLLTTLALATEAPLVLAPAMNQRMWRHPATAANVETLTERGARLIGPEDGPLAEGESGPGRMTEPADIAAQLAGGGALAEKKVLVTAGPTEEPIDPVRFVGNRSSGKMGYAVARAAIESGAEVTLVSGPTALSPPAGCELIRVRTASQMANAVKQQAGNHDVFIGVAAVADYTPADVSSEKIKKRGKSLTLELTRTPDILADVAANSNRPFCVGFAAETTNIIAHARAKLEKKKVDLICANRVGDKHAFERDDNALTVISTTDETDLGHGSKRLLAQRLIALIAQKLGGSELARDSSAK